MKRYTWWLDKYHDALISNIWKASYVLAATHRKQFCHQTYLLHFSITLQCPKPSLYSSGTVTQTSSLVGQIKSYYSTWTFIELNIDIYYVQLINLSFIIKCKILPNSRTQIRFIQVNYSLVSFSQSFLSCFSYKSWKSENMKCFPTWPH